MRLENSSKFNLAPVPPRSLPSLSTWFRNAQRERVREDGRGGGRSGDGGARGCCAFPCTRACDGEGESEGDADDGGGRAWMGEGGCLGAVASASGEYEGREGFG